MGYKLRCILNNRKTLYLVFSVVLVSVFTLTIAYAALNTVLKITGTTEVVASSWDIRLDNVQLHSGSVSSNEPTIIDKTTASFSTTLKNPGDYYMFTVDVINNGSIDAMIDSIVKTPTLTGEQAKYLNYIVEYQSGESISTKQLVKTNSFVRLKVKVELRSDIQSSDLPQNAETLNLAFKVNYVQADETDTSTIPNSGKLVKVLSGNYDTVGSEVCIDTECFYVISSDTDSVTMLAKYNLLVGNRYDDINGFIELENPTGIQDMTAIGYFIGSSKENPIIGVKQFSSSNYWVDDYESYDYIFNENSYYYKDVENYKKYLEKLGTSIIDARLITIEELESLGCSRSKYNCSNAPSWVYSTTYWTGSVYLDDYILRVATTSGISEIVYTNGHIGVRPVITISKGEF